MNRYDSQIRHRRSIRLQGYDYAQAGAYFVTICANNRECLFGEIAGDATVLNAFGHVVADEWLFSAEIRQEIELGEFVVMPNHFHGIVAITDRERNAEGRGTARRAPTVECFGKPVAGSLPTIVRSFKSAVTKRINEISQSPGVPVWQRSYYEHIIRDEADYARIAEYIADNPRRWAEDALHPDNMVVGDAGVGARRAVPLRETRRPR